jgi:hypothetical protein
MPHRDSDDAEQYPVVIHRVVLEAGAVFRVAIEHLPTFPV